MLNLECTVHAEYSIYYGVYMLQSKEGIWMHVIILGVCDTVHFFLHVSSISALGGCIFTSWVTSCASHTIRNAQQKRERTASMVRTFKTKPKE